MSVAVLKDLRGLFGSARDQGDRPTCLAFAASDNHAALRPPWFELSCEFAFYHAQRRGGRPPTSGATLRDMLFALKADGQPMETDWPYLPVLPANIDDYGPPAGSKVFRRGGAIRPTGLIEVISELDIGHPVLLIMMISDAFYSPDAAGVIIAPSAEGPDPDRVHAVVAVGYGKVGGEVAVLVRNSWGTDWGTSGHAWLPESYLVPRLTRVALLTEDVDVPATNLAA